MIFRVNDLVKLKKVQTKVARPEVYGWIGFVTRVQHQLPTDVQTVTVLWPENGEEDDWASDWLEIVKNDG